MATRIVRVLRILALLQSGVPHNAVQLAKILGVHRRTIFRDIADLRRYGLMINYDEMTARYWIPAPLQLPDESVSTEELMALLLSAHMSYLPVFQVGFDLAAQAATKISKKLPVSKRAELARLFRAFDSERNKTSIRELQVLDAIVDSLRRQCVLRISTGSDRPRLRAIKVIPCHITPTPLGWSLSALRTYDQRGLKVLLRDIDEIKVLAESFSPPHLSRPHWIEKSRPVPIKD